MFKEFLNLKAKDTNQEYALEFGLELLINVPYTFGSLPEDPKNSTLTYVCM